MPPSLRGQQEREHGDESAERCGDLSCLHGKVDSQMDTASKCPSVIDRGLHKHHRESEMNRIATQELHGLHDTLLSLNLKSHEVNQIRQSLLSANQQLLTMPLLHGQTDLSKIDFAKIEKQFNTIQMDMVKLASLVLNNSTVSNNTTA